jgi:formate C-acetyltransferase
MTITEGVRSDKDATQAERPDFVSGPWQDSIDLRDFIQRNYTPYLGDATFLAGPTARTTGSVGQAVRHVPRGTTQGRL